MSTNPKSNDKFGHEIYGPGKRYFDDVVIDNLMEAFLELTATVWTYHDRTLILERVLQDLIGEDKGVELDQLIEQYRPSEEDKQYRKQEREQMIDRIFAAFAKRPL